VGIEATTANLSEAIAKASNQAGLLTPTFEAAFLGLASVTSAKDRCVIREIAKLLKLPADNRLGVDHDCRTALAGGLSGRPGIVQIAGTGSATYGRNAEGKEWRSGGWGFLLADEGGGYWFGLKAMKAAIRFEDGRSKYTVLRRLIMDRLELSTMNEIMHRLHVTGMSRSEVASLCPLLIDAAKDGDDVALGIVEEGMADIAECIQAVARCLGLRHGTICEVALVGGLFNAGDVVVQSLRQAVNRRLPDSSVVLAEMQPVLGAGLLALECLGIPLDRKIISEAKKHKMNPGGFKPYDHNSTAESTSNQGSFQL
jgi:N-acetylglucosamine kinase-like BadF-type ATPase